MFGFFKNKKTGSVKTQSETPNTTPNGMIETMKKKYLFTFLGDVDEEEFNKQTFDNSRRRTLPIDIDASQIAAYSRYKGADIGFYITKEGGLGFYLIKQIPLRLFASMTRKENPKSQQIIMTEEIHEHIELEIINIDDLEYIKKVTDTYFQKYFLMLIPLMDMGDKLIFNRNGVSIEFKKTLTETELMLIMSFLYQLEENLKIN